MPVSLVDILQWRAASQPHKLAFRFLTDGEFEEVVITYKELDRRARSIGALLQASAKPGDRALILFPPGLDFIAAYLGCLYAKIVAIPAFPPHPVRIEKNLPAILCIAADAKPSVALLTRSLFDVLKSRDEVRAGLFNMKLIVTDEDKTGAWAEQWQRPDITGNDLAFLQYTSGSTTLPKGVMITHGNLLHNMTLIEKSFGVTDQTHGIIWLPPYHDMGLISGILQPLYSGILVTLMPYMMFLQRPFRWLQAISHFHGTASGGPNFAYDLCVKKITREQREQLDLSRWEVAFNGAEPVYHKTLDQFAEYFAPCGFHRDAFLPCYGLAESTLLVTGGPKSISLKKIHLVNSALEKNKILISPESTGNTRTVISCGHNQSDQKIRIVNPETLKPCNVDEVGEIWLSGPCVAKGYWNKPPETELTFGAQLSNNEEETYLRTGDLGFQKDGDYYITGRIKNLIISEGKNHYPQDIERTVESSHPAILPGGSVAFSINNDGPERIIIVAEIKHRSNINEEELIKTIRYSISMHHGITIDDIRLTNPGAIPRTTSGKKRHFLCREYYLKGTLKEITLT